VDKSFHFKCSFLLPVQNMKGNPIVGTASS
jgi:hypothetical protein